MKTLANTRPLFLFFLLAFGISWCIPGLAMLLAALIGAFEASLEMTSPLTYIAIGHRPWRPLSQLACERVGMRSKPMPGTVCTFLVIGVGI